MISTRRLAYRLAWILVAFLLVILGGILALVAILGVDVARSS
jgi:hypothetical protein